MDPWTHARASFQRHFAPLVDRGLELERLPDAPAYWSLHAATLSEHFPPEVFFDLPALRTGAERRGQAELARVSGEQPLRDFTVVRERGDVVAMFSGEQRGEGAYRMWHTHVRTDHRRRGIYRQLLESTIAYTRELGFDAITSEHAPCNNAVLIAKLRAGFRVAGLELDAMAGPSLLLRYFHNADHQAVYEHRCGLATINPRVAAAGAGAFHELRAQLTAPAP